MFAKLWYNVVHSFLSNCSNKDNGVGTGISGGKLPLYAFPENLQFRSMRQMKYPSTKKTYNSTSNY